MALWLEVTQKNTLRRIAEEVSRLADSILLSEDFSTDTPAKLARLTKHASSLLAENLNKAPASDYDGVHHFLTRVVSHLRFVERARVTQTPWSLIPATEAFLQRQVTDKRHFIIRPTWGYNYSIRGDFWGFFRDSLAIWGWFPLDELRKRLVADDKIGLNDDEEIHCISFPRVERLNCLLHANWGHEVGHILATRWLDSNFSSLWSAAEADIRGRIRTEVENRYSGIKDKLFTDLLIDQDTAELTTQVRDVAAGGIAELLSDMIGVHLFGLSALASAAEFAFMGPVDASPLDSSNYPPWRYRLRKMAEYDAQDISPDGAANYPAAPMRPLLEYLTNVRDFASATPDRTVINSTSQTREAYTLIEKHWEGIKTDVLKELPPSSAQPYRTKARQPIILKLIDRLSAGVPPNETGYASTDTIMLQDIIMSAWAYKQQALKANPDWGTRDEYSVLFRLVLKAIESWHFDTVWGPRVRRAEDVHAN